MLIPDWLLILAKVAFLAIVYRLGWSRGFASAKAIAAPALDRLRKGGTS
jgi:hypothetical protein